VLTYTGFSSFRWTDGGFVLLGTNVGVAAGIASGDFNGDGIPDVVTGGSVWLGRGDGFGAPSMPVNYTAPLAVGDFNGDGRLDVVGSQWQPISQYPYSVSVLTIFLNTCSPGSP
jgi:hypothetical protein